MGAAAGVGVICIVLAILSACYEFFGANGVIAALFILIVGFIYNTMKHSR
jgi:hypothetical protein